MAIAPMTAILKNVPAWLDAAEKLAEEAGFEPDQFVDHRLHPGQFPLVRQIQAAADSLKLACSRLSGVEAPKHDDSERTLAALRDRVRETVAFVEGIDASAFAGAEEKLIKVPFAPGKVATGLNMTVQFSVPNFYFHVSHAYAILRSSGVPLGKRSFISHVDLQDA